MSGVPSLATAPRDYAIDHTAARAPDVNGPAVGLVVLVALVLTCIHLIAQYQGPRWASPLLIGDHLFALGLALVVLLYSYAIGHVLYRALLTSLDEPLTIGIVSIGLGMGTLSTLILCLGFARLYYGAVFLLLGAAMTVLLREELARAITACVRVLPRVAGNSGLRPPSRGQVIAVALIAVSLVLVLVRLAVPMSSNVSGTDWDGLVYHVESSNLYIQAHEFIPLPNIPLANAPAGEDMLFIPGLLAGVETLAKVLNLPLVILLGLATYNLGRRSFSPAVGWLSAIILFNTIWLLPIVPTSLTDIAPAIMLVQALSDVMVWTNKTAILRPCAEKPAERPFARLQMQDILLIRAGLLAGIASAMRLTDLPATLAISLLVGLMTLWFVRRGVIWRLAWSLRNGAITACATIVPLAPWLAKNQFFFSNPLYPQFVITNTVAQAASGTANITPAAGSRSDHILWILSTLPQLAWEYVTPLAAILVLAPIVLRCASCYVLVSFAVIAGALWLEYVPIFLPPRYMLVFVAAISVATAATIGAILDMPARTHKTTIVVAASICAVSGLLWLTYVPFSGGNFARAVVVLGAELSLIAIMLVWPPRKTSGRGLLELVAASFLCVNSLVGVLLQVDTIQKNDAVAAALGRISRDEYLGAHTWYFHAYQYVNEYTAPGTVVALVHITPNYYLDRPFFNDWYGQVFRMLQNSPQARPGVFAEWCGARVSVMVFSRRLNQVVAGTGEMADDVRPLAQFDWLRFPGLDPRLLYSANGVDVIHVTPCAALKSASSIPTAI